MLEGNCRKKCSVILKIFDDFFIAVLYKSACPRCNLFCEVTLCINILTERKSVNTAYTVVIFTECRSCMNNTCTVCKSYIIICNNIETLFVIFKEIKERCISYSLKI